MGPRDRMVQVEYRNLVYKMKGIKRMHTAFIDTASEKLSSASSLSLDALASSRPGIRSATSTAELRYSGGLLLHSCTAHSASDPSVEYNESREPQRQ